MNPHPFLLALLVAASPTAADKPPKETKDARDAKRAGGAPGDDLIAQAEGKVQAGDLDAAVELLRRAAAQPALAGAAQLRLGRLHQRRHELDAAIDALKAAAEALAGPAKGEALGRLAVVQETRGLPDSAATAEAAAAADAEGPWPAIALARARARQGRHEEAAALAARAGSAEAPGLAAAAFVREVQGDFAAAEAGYRAALAAEAADLPASIGLARVLRQTGRGSEAEPLLQKLIQAAPGLVEAYKELARLKLALGRAEEAVGDAAIAAALAENDPDAQLLAQQVAIAKAMELLPKGQADLAIEELKALRDRHPDLAEARVGLGRALLAKRQLDAAAAELQKAAELKPSLAEAHFQLGFLHHAHRNDAAAALPHYEKAVAADPARLEYRTQLGAVLSDLKQHDRAIAELQRVVDTPGYSRPEAWIYLGRAHMGAKRYKEALAPLEKAAAIAPSSPDAEASLGWCYFGLKDAENFKKHAGKARALGHKETTLLQYLTRVEAGEPIK